MSVTSDLLRFVPVKATHTVVEERAHRGQSVFAVVAIVPDGASVILNGYGSEALARSTSQEINCRISAVPH